MGRQTILVVDDDASVRELIGLMLETDLDAGIVLAEDGLDALQKLDGSPPALVVTDVMMPRVDGVELIRRLRASPHTRRVPVLVVGASASWRDAAMAAGGTDYLDKPFDLYALLGKVRGWLPA